MFTVNCKYGQYSRFWEPDSCSASRETSPQFMETEGLLPTAQELATCPSTGPTYQVDIHHIPLRHILVTSSHLCLSLSSGFLTTFYPMCATCPAHLILLDFDHSNNIWRYFQSVQLLNKQLMFWCLQSFATTWHKLLQKTSSIERNIRTQSLFLEFITVEHPVTLTLH
jgi:hypothetical protein